MPCSAVDELLGSHTHTHTYIHPENRLTNPSQSYHHLTTSTYTYWIIRRRYILVSYQASSHHSSSDWRFGVCLVSRVLFLFLFLFFFFLFFFYHYTCPASCPLCVSPLPSPSSTRPRHFASADWAFDASFLGSYFSSSSSIVWHSRGKRISFVLYCFVVCSLFSLLFPRVACAGALHSGGGGGSAALFKSSAFFLLFFFFVRSLRSGARKI